MSACAGFLNMVFKHSAWRRGLMVQRDAYLAGKAVSYPLYCPICGCLKCEIHNVAPRDQPFNFRHSTTDGSNNQHWFIARFVGGVIWASILTTFYNDPALITGHDYEHFEFDDWEYYDDEAAENDPSKAKFVIPDKDGNYPEVPKWKYMEN